MSAPQKSRGEIQWEKIDASYHDDLKQTAKDADKSCFFDVLKEKHPKPSVETIVEHFTKFNFKVSIKNMQKIY